MFSERQHLSTDSSSKQSRNKADSLVIAKKLEEEIRLERKKLFCISTNIQEHIQKSQWCLNRSTTDFFIHI